MRRLQLSIICCLLPLLCALAQEEAGDEAGDEIKREETKILWTRLGAMRGLAVTEKEATHYEFLGVPYAEPPVGKLRFLAPAPAR